MGALSFQLDKLLVCEGREERALVEQMIKEQRAPAMDLCSIDELEGGGGINALGHCLKRISGISGFANIKTVGIFADSDADQNAALRNIQARILEANSDPDVNGRYSIPAAAFTRTTNGPISTTIILAPGRQKAGCLETLLLDLLKKNYSHTIECVERLVECSGIGAAPHNWNPSKQDKARVRAAIATIHKKWPALPLSMLWKNASHILDVKDETFDELSSDLALL